MTDPEELVRVARVARTHGLQGEVSLELLGGDGDRLRPGTTVVVRGRRHQVEGARTAGGRMLCRLTDVSDQRRAAQLLGAYLEVPVREARPLPPGEYFHFQLVGLRVVDESGADWGELVEVESYPANDVYTVRREGAEVPVPAVREAVLEVDLSRGRITVAGRFLKGWADAG